MDREGAKRGKWPEMVHIGDETIVSGVLEIKSAAHGKLTCSSWVNNKILEMTKRIIELFLFRSNNNTQALG